MARWFYVAMHREPVVMWSVFLGAVGVALPLVVPRDAFSTSSRSSATTVPSASAVVKALKP